MKLSTLLIFISLLQLSANVHSQNKHIRLDADKTYTIKELFQAIEDKTSYRFFYNDDLADLNKRVSVSRQDMQVKDLLSLALDHTLVSFRLLENDMIIVAPKEILLQQKITGLVTDSYGDPMPGVNVVVKGTTHGIVTDQNGKYVIEISGKDVTLVFSFVGYKSKEVLVNNQTIIDMVLEEDNREIDEVIVVGYGVQRKVTSTGAVSKVEGRELSKLTVVNTEKALQGLTPGITIIDRGGAPGSDDPNIYLRGVGTTGQSSPLILVDGIEMGLSQVPSQEIESISVLKDAASASIYGSRAAHGVILVTTKRGKVGKMKLSYDGYIGFQDRAVKAKGVDAREYMEMVNEASTNAGNSPIFSEDDIVTTENGSDPYNHAYIKYPDEVYKTNYITEHNIGVSGGNETGRYMMSFNYLEQPGITDNSSYKRYNYRVNTDVAVGSRMKVSADLSYRHIDRLWPQRQGAAEKAAWSMVPTVPIRYANDNYTLDNQNDNPVASLDLDVVGKDLYTIDALNGQVKVDYEPIKDLTLTGVASVNGMWTRQKIHSKNYKFYNASNQYVTDWNTQNGVKDERYNSHQVTLRFLANYKKRFRESHDLNVLFGMEQISYRKYLSSAERKNLISDASPDVSLGSASNQYAEGSPTLWGINSFFGRVNYGFKDKYLFEANVRTDGSSRFADGDKWGVFPSVSAAWRISEESFFENISFVNSLKVRASWGQTGNERIGEFVYLPRYGVEDVVMNGSLVTGVRQEQMANPMVTWETVELTDVGLDFLLFNNRVFGEIDYYTKDTKDILLDLAIPKFIGLKPPPQNAGVVRNSGVEAMIGYRKMDGKFRYSVSGNFAYNKNKWIDRGGDDDNIDGWIIQKEGYALNSFYIFEADGLIANDAELAAYKARYKADPRGITALKPGDIKLVDSNGDGTIDNNDRQVYTSNIPKFTFGLNMNAEYYNFDLTLFFQGALGSKHYIYGEWYEGPSYEAFTGLHFRDRWTPQNENPDASVPRLETASNRNASSYNTFYLKNNSYIRLKNVQLGYTIPSKITEKVKIERVRFYISASNLFTISGLDQGLDPEANSGRLYSFPPLRIMNFGVNLLF